MTSEVTQEALEPCPFCRKPLRVVPSLARAFDPPRPLVEYHHADGDCIIKRAMWAFYDDEPEKFDKFAAAWNTRLTAQSGESEDPHRILKNALFALEKLKAPAMIYGGVLTDGGKRAWLEYSLREQGDYSVFSGEGRSGVDAPRLNVTCETTDENLVGRTYLEVLRVEAEDDGSFTAVVNHWPAALNARQSGDDEEEKAYRIGKDEGYQDAMQEIDLATGGDGEFRFCLGGDTERHCPDAETMRDRILDRFNARQSGEGDKK